MTKIDEQVKENRKKFRVDHFDMVVSEYIQRKENKELILNPPYQRLFRWGIESQSELIESILIGIPIPPIFVFQNGEAKWEIIDGLQRTTSLINFLKEGSEQKFTGCQIITELNDKTFSQLPDNIQRIVKNTRIRIELVEETDDIFSQYLLFNRLNANGEKLEAQEIRNFLIYKLNNAFYANIQSLGNSKEFKETLGLKLDRIKKQENVEYVLKFFLGRDISNSTEAPKYDRIEDLITNETEQFLKKNNQEFLNNEIEVFKKTFNIIYSIFGANSFRWHHPKINNIANTFSIAIGISCILDKVNQSNQETLIKDITRQYFESDEYKKITARGYSPTKRMYELNRYSAKFFKGAIK